MKKMKILTLKKKKAEKGIFFFPLFFYFTSFFTFPFSTFFSFFLPQYHFFGVPEAAVATAIP